MFEVYYFNDHKARFFKTYKTERAAEIAVMSLKMEGITAWIQEGQKSHMALFFMRGAPALALAPKFHYTTWLRFLSIGNLYKD